MGDGIIGMDDENTDAWCSGVVYDSQHELKALLAVTSRLVLKIEGASPMKV